MSAYNQKLFSGGPRSRLHFMRFHWLNAQLQEPAKAYSLFELGCFDCRSLGYVPQPSRYVGADAGWEGGIDDARMTYNKVPWMELVTVQSAYDLEPYKSQKFDYSIALETLEHMNDMLLRGYIEFLAAVTKKRLLVTVPVEIGPMFLAKHIAKTVVPGLESGDTGTYTLAEVMWATLGKVEHVRRFEHKGFDYRKLVKLIAEYFDIVKVEGIPFAPFPALSFQVGIVAEPKQGRSFA